MGGAVHGAERAGLAARSCVGIVRRRRFGVEGEGLEGRLMVCAFWAGLRRGEEFFEEEEGQGLGFQEGASCGGLRGSSTRVCEIRYCWHVGSWNNHEYARASITGQSQAETVNGLSVGAQDAGRRMQTHVKSLSPSSHVQCQYLGACGSVRPRRTNADRCSL